MPEDFRGPRLKLARANTHITDLHDLLKRFIKLHAYKAVADFDLEPGWIVWVARGQGGFNHDDFGPWISDVIHNLRDSLDLAVSVLCRNAGLCDEGIYFPTGKSLDHFKKAIGKGPKPQPTVTTKFPPKVIAVLESWIEPYTHGHGYWLRTLHNLAILDKHRLIVPTLFGVSAVHMKIGGGDVPAHFFNKPVPIEDGRKLYRIRRSEWPEIKVNDEAPLTLSIQFDRRSGELWHLDVIEGLYRLMNVTQEALDGLETCL
jgi:hypothetical protein